MAELNLIREMAKKVQYEVEKQRREALLANTRADALDQVRWDLELAADEWDEEQKKAEAD